MSGQDCCPEAADDPGKDSAEAASLKASAQSSLQRTCSRQAEPVKGFFLQDAHQALSLGSPSLRIFVEAEAVEVVLRVHAVLAACSPRCRRSLLWRLSILKIVFCLFLSKLLSVRS